MGSGRQRPGLEVRQQTGVLLGLLGDPVDRGVGAGLDLAQPDPGRALARGLGIDRVAVGARDRVAEHLVQPGLDPRRDGALEAHRLVVGFGPAEARSTVVSSHSSRAWRRKMPSAAARPAGVRCSSRPSEMDTRPSATSRRNISLAACVDTPTCRATWAAVTLCGSVPPVITRNVSRYCCAALERSRGSWCFGMRSGYGTGSTGGRSPQEDGGGDRAAKPGEPEDDAQERRSRLGRGATGRCGHEQGGRDRDDQGDDGGDHGPAGDGRQGQQQEEDGDLGGPGDRRRARIAGRGEPAAAGELAGRPADGQADRQPADDRACDAPAERRRGPDGQRLADATERGRRLDRRRGGRPGRRGARAGPWRRTRWLRGLVAGRSSRAGCGIPP